jgi:hypothetical protein
MIAFAAPDRRTCSRARLRKATPGAVAAGCCFRGERSSDPGSPSIDRAITSTTLAAIIPIDALPHPHEGAASSDCSVRGEGITPTLARLRSHSQRALRYLRGSSKHRSLLPLASGPVGRVVYVAPLSGSGRGASRRRRGGRDCSSRFAIIGMIDCSIGVRVRVAHAVVDEHRVGPRCAPRKIHGSEYLHPQELRLFGDGHPGSAFRGDASLRVCIVRAGLCSEVSGVLGPTGFWHAPAKTLRCHGNMFPAHGRLRTVRC